MSDAFWKAFLNWPWITLCVSSVSAAWYFVRKEIQHKKTARFDIALSKIYTQIERFKIKDLFPCQQKDIYIIQLKMLRNI